jgi:hypothetical protein
MGIAAAGRPSWKASKASLVVLALAGPVARASADPVTASTERKRHAEWKAPAPTTPVRAPPAREHTGAEVAGAPRPGEESGRIDEADPGDSSLRIIARGLLFAPRLAVMAALFPVRGLVWAEDHVNLGAPDQATVRPTRTIALYPTIAYETGFGTFAGAVFVLRNVLGRDEQFAVDATTGAVAGELDRARLGAGVHSGDRFRRLQLGMAAVFDRRPADPFHGFGDDDRAVETHVRHQQARIAATADTRVVDGFHVLGAVEVAQLWLAPSTQGTPIDRVYDTRELAGFDHGARHARGDVEVRWDGRGRHSRWEPREVPSTGSLAAVFIGGEHQLDGGADFWRCGVELQHHWRIANGPRLVVTRFHGEAVSGARDQVPFTELPALGGGAFLRGYAFERFRDRVAASGSVQYEWDLSHFVQASLFIDAGRVFSALDDVSVHDLRIGYGLGFQVHRGRSFNLEGNLATTIDGGLFASLWFNPVPDARPRWR